MAQYIIGDVQGCFDELQRLLDLINYDSSNDTLWFTGDLVNRGFQSALTLQFVMSLGSRAVTVLGNHDLHMLAVAAKVEKFRRNDTFSDVTTHQDAELMLSWLRQQPLLHFDERLNLLMVHAGLTPEWDVATARDLAREVETVLRGDDALGFFANMYGNKPNRWSPDLAGWERLRFITNTFTRLRYCDNEGHQILDAKGALGTQPKGYRPWFEIEHRRSKTSRIVFGHWAALGAAAHKWDVYSVDSGCAWGGSLTALRLEPKAEFFNVACEKKSEIS